MKLEISQFGGIIPGTDPVNLPQNGAQVAQDVDLSEGTIKPWSVTNAFRKLHTNDVPPVMIGQVDSGDFSQPAKPISPPSISYEDLISDSELSALFGTISAKVWKFDRTDGTGDSGPLSVNLTKESTAVTRTATGFVLHLTMGASAIILNMIKGETYEVVGPLYQVNINNTTVTGQSYNFPSSVQSGGPVIPAFTIPIYSRTGTKHATARQVGNLQLVDVAGPSASGSYSYPGDGGNVYVHIGGSVDLHFECNWIRNRPQRFYYVSQNVTGDHDGPESDVSGEALIEPGKYASIGNTGDRLYRSANTDSGFGLIHSGGGTFKDDLTDAITEDLPPNGTVTDITTVGSIIHPAGYAVYYKGDTLYPSSEWIDAPRYWAVPAEYAYNFDGTDIQCIALSGGTILVFTEEGVYRASGQHPGRLSVYKISDLPISNKLTLWQDEQDIGWCNEEGLVIWDGRDGTLLTGDYMRADRWTTYTPAARSAEVNDKTVCLTHATDNGLRFDFRGDRTAAISEFTATNGSADPLWKSKVFTMPKPTSWYAGRIQGSFGDDVLLSLYADGVKVVDKFAVASEDEFLLPRTVKAWKWEVQLDMGNTGSNEIRGIALATNKREL